MKKIIRRQYQVCSNGYEYTVTLIRNDFWRWSIDSMTPFGKGSFSYKSNALTHWGAIKETDKRLVESREEQKDE